MLLSGISSTNSSSPALQRLLPCMTFFPDLSLNSCLPPPPSHGTHCVINPSSSELIGHVISVMLSPSSQETPSQTHLGCTSLIPCSFKSDEGDNQSPSLPSAWGDFVPRGTREASLPKHCPRLVPTLSMAAWPIDSYCGITLPLSHPWSIC